MKIKILIPVILLATSVSFGNNYGNPAKSKISHKGAATGNKIDNKAAGYGRPYGVTKRKISNKKPVAVKKIDNKVAGYGRPYGAPTKRNISNKKPVNVKKMDNTVAGKHGYGYGAPSSTAIQK